MNSIVDLTPEQRQEGLRLGERPGIQRDSYLSTYLADLGLDGLPENGLVLDVGSGNRGVMQLEASLEFPTTTVIAMGTSYRDFARYNSLYLDVEALYVHTDDEVERMRQHSFLGVSALAQEIPFPDNTFDLVVSHAAIPLYLPKNAIHYQASLAEEVRVVKPGLQVINGPMYEADLEVATKTYAAIGISSQFVKVETVDIPEGHPEQGLDEWYRTIVEKPAA